MTLPILTSERLVLDSFRETDVPSVFAYASDPEVTRFMSWHVHSTPEVTQGFLRRVLTPTADQWDWAMRLRESPESAIGGFEFSLRDPTEGEIHYTLARPFWGRGLMTEAANVVLDWAFASLPELERVLSAAVDANRGSTRVMEKCGMSRVGEYSEFREKDGLTHRLVVYAISRSEWRAGTTPG